MFKINVAYYIKYNCVGDLFVPLIKIVYRNLKCFTKQFLKQCPVFGQVVQIYQLGET